MNKLTIEIEVIEARDLLASDSNGFSDPYVVIDPTAGFTSGAKTPIIKKTLNPVWNYNTVLVVDPSFKKIKFRVFDWDRFSKDDCLGTCSFSASMFADGVPLDVWQPLVQRPEKKSKGKKGPYPTKGELHVRISAKFPPPPPPPFQLSEYTQTCQTGDWYTFQCAAAGAPPMMVATTQEDAASVPAFLEKVSLGLGWDFAEGDRLDLDASVIAFNDKNEDLDIVYFGNRTGFGGAIQHSGDNLTGAGKGDDEVISIDLPRLPPNVWRLACVVNCYSDKKLSSAKSAYVRLFVGKHTLGFQKLTKIVDSVGMFFCLLQRNSAGAWFFQTVVKPISGTEASDSILDIVEILGKIPKF